MWDAAGMMLIGMALLKVRVLTGELSTRRYVAIAAAAYGVGLPPAIWAAQSGFDPVHETRVRTLYEPLRLTMAIGHIAVVMLLCRLDGFRKLLAPVGRMALTNYLLASVLCGFVFYGYGLGLYLRLARHELYWIVAGVWIIPIVSSLLWLRRFDYGPVEWAWRCLIYWRRLPIRHFAPARVVSAS